MSWKHLEKPFAMVTVMKIRPQKRWTLKAAATPWREEILVMTMVTNYSALNLFQAQFYPVYMYSYTQQRSNVSTIYISILQMKKLETERGKACSPRLHSL